MPRTKGGGIGYTIGTPVNGIEKFSPSLIPDLVLWIKSDEKFLLKESVQSYCNKQSYFIKEALVQYFSNSLKYKVITEIKSDTANQNSLIPLNIDSDIATVFPTFRSVPGELDAVNISNYKEPITGKVHNLQLVTSRPVEMEKNASVYTISYGISITQNTITNQIQITANFIENPIVDAQADPTNAPEINPNNSVLAADIKPSAEFSEIVVFSRPLTLDENAKMEGYLAYKQNTQYALPAKHPYLPNMMVDPIFSTITPKLADIETSLRQQLQNINIAKNDYINEKGNTGVVLDAPVHIESIQTALNQIATFIPILSKGYLYAKKINDLSLSAIYNAISTQKMSESITNESITEFMNSSRVLIEKSDAFVSSLQKSYSQPFVSQPSQTGGGISEHVDQKEESQKFYSNIQITSRQIATEGLIAYNSLQSTVKQELSTFVDTIVHQWADIQSIDTTLKSLLKPVGDSIVSGKWLTYLTIDKTYTDVFKNNLLHTVKYNDEKLNLIQTYYTFVNEQMKHGDYAFILEEFKEINSIFSAISQMAINPIHKPTYFNYFNGIIKKSAEYYNKFKEISSLYTKLVNNISSFITIAKETGQTSTFTDKMIDTTYTMSDVYIRKVIKLDEILFGFEYVETDANGLIVSVKPFFVNDYKFIDSKYVKTTPYLANETNITITYHILEPLTQSVYNGLNTNEKTPLFTHSLSKLYEIPRYELNAIHCFDATGSPPPILLPTQAIHKESWCLIYNTGDNHIAVRSPENHVDLIGPEYGILYIYTQKTTLYSSYKWGQNQIPYDTLLLCPRTAHSMYIDEIGTSIYIKPTKTGYEPVYTTDGFLSEVVRASDTNVYDIDDVYLSNPYSVSSVSVDQRTNLVFNPSKKKMVKIAPTSFKIFQDDTTGFAVLFNENGGVAINEYGFAKVARTPIQEIGAYKISGAYGDLILEPTTATITCPYDFEPFLQFNHLFTTQKGATVLNKSVYVTDSNRPIVNPHGIIVENLSSVPVNSEIQTNLPIAVYSPPTGVDTSATERLTTSYNAAKDYIQHEIDIVNTYVTEIKPFGDDAVKMCKDAIASYQTFMNKILVNESVFQTQMSKLTIDTVKANIAETLEEYFKSKGDVDNSIKVYRKGIEEIKSVKDSVKYWESDGVALMDKVVSEINLQGQEILQQFQTTSIPDLSELLAITADAHADFNDTLKFCINYILTVPVLISEVHQWYKIIQPKFELLKTLYEDINSIKTTDLPKINSEYQTKQIYGGIQTKIQTLFGTVQKSWLTIHDKKTAIDTYLQGQKLPPDQYASLKDKVSILENQIAKGDDNFNSLYKQIKTGAPTEKLYNLVLQFQQEVSQIQTLVPNTLTV